MYCTITLVFNSSGTCTYNLKDVLNLTIVILNCVKVDQHMHVHGTMPYA